ncbi:protein of unknown function [Micromonospora nigra]|uniref:DUF4350 domain-containing protein n=1 Tax=Micromonospora nigra TaxID=145857 RepID=A0A1C6SFI9_9ACTN|nr:DUF4350 domain-containing protein [Micromonospora nigra]SCL28232.1 protein of unknown function [Micromonospora nigra]
MSGAPATTNRPDPAAPARRRRRRHRILLPVGLAVLLVATTLVTHEVDQPDQDAPGFLSPTATGADGGSRLADALRELGVEVRRETDTGAALRATRSGPATLLVPAPDLLHPASLDRLGMLPTGRRVVLVDPSRRVLEGAGLRVAPGPRRWAARAVEPSAYGRPCLLPEVARVRAAAVDRQRWTTKPPSGGDTDFCFAGGVALLPGVVDTLVVGASDPFRNDRIDEWDNRAFATGLLGTTGRVVWLDLDGPEPPPPTPTLSAPVRTPEAYPSGFGESGEDRPDDAYPGRPGGPDGDGGPGDGGDDDGRGRADAPDDAPNPLWSVFPAWFWALLAQLLLAAVLAALWRARRLGPPAPDALPVTVRNAETVLGRARLYQRAGARDAAASTLRDAARARLLPRLGLPADTPPAGVAAAVAARTGENPHATHDLLYGDPPETDRDLVELAERLDRTTRTVAPGTVPLPHRPEGDPR